ncbi:NTP transferase domain-containing protein [Candidatus Bipolaricaulota bacterium]|nr:NTP transferase domain-containing protein [Candidatus Bipolaricaulota bacterium]
MKTIILAGGYGARLYPITANRPKPLLPIAGRPIIDFILDAYPFCDRPIVSTNKRFEHHFREWSRHGRRDVQLVVEETTSEKEKLGTVGALQFLIQRLKISEDILVIGGDNIFEFSLRDFVNAYDGNPLIALCDVEDMKIVQRRYGVAIVRQNRIAEFQEKPEAPRSTLASTACYIYPERILPLIDEFLGRAEAGKDAPGYFNSWLLRDRKISIDPFVFNAGWYDIGDRASYIEANQRYSGQDSWLAKDVQVTSSVVNASVILGNGKIENSNITGCVIDRDCYLSGAELQDCLVGAGTIIKHT